MSPKPFPPWVHLPTTVKPLSSDDRLLPIPAFPPAVYDEFHQAHPTPTFPWDTLDSPERKLRRTERHSQGDYGALCRTSGELVRPATAADFDRFRRLRTVIPFNDDPHWPDADGRAVHLVENLS